MEHKFNVGDKATVLTNRSNGIDKKHIWNCFEIGDVVQVTGLHDYSEDREGFRYTVADNGGTYQIVTEVQLERSVDEPLYSEGDLLFITEKRGRSCHAFVLNDTVKVVEVFEERNEEGIYRYGVRGTDVSHCPGLYQIVYEDQMISEKEMEEMGIEEDLGVLYVVTEEHRTHCFTRGTVVKRIAESTYRDVNTGVAQCIDESVPPVPLMDILDGEQESFTGWVADNEVEVLDFDGDSLDLGDIVIVLDASEHYVKHNLPVGTLAKVVTFSKEYEGEFKLGVKVETKEGETQWIEPEELQWIGLTELP